MKDYDRAEVMAKRAVDALGATNARLISILMRAQWERHNYENAYAAAQQFMEYDLSSDLRVQFSPLVDKIYQYHDFSKNGEDLYGAPITVRVGGKSEPQIASNFDGSFSLALNKYGDEVREELVRVDASGAILDNITLKTRYFNWQTTGLGGDGSLTALAGKSFAKDKNLVRANAKGKTLWSKRLKDTTGGYASDKIISLPDAGVLVVGKTRNPAGYDLRRFSDRGKEMWRQTYSEVTGNGTGYVHYVGLPEGTIFQMGSTKPKAGIPTKIWIRKIDFTGKSLWTRFIGPPDRYAFPIFALSNKYGGLTVLSRSPELRLQELGPEGRIILEQVHDKLHPSRAEYRGMARLPNGGFAILKTISTRSTSNRLQLRVTTVELFNEQLRRTAQLNLPESAFYGQGISTNKDGTIAIVGSTVTASTSTAPQLTDLYLFRPR
ncbi:hypothetical protein [Algimonas arctica]|nr:hypothetical protein [Algimonas arctica]